MRTPTIKTSFFLFPVILLCLFQFLAIVLSLTPLPFPLIILLGFVVATPVAQIISSEFSQTFSCSYTKLTIAAFLSAVLSLIVVLRLNFNIADFICPTGILGLIIQITEGNFPVSYQSFPEFPMNYHQGFLLLTGLVTMGLKIPVAAALKLTFAVLYFLVNMGVMLFLLQSKNRFYTLPPLLFLFTASAGTVIYKFLSIPTQPRISVLEFSTGNSWPLALALLIALLFITKAYKHSRLHITYVALIVLTLSTINAVVFQILLLGLGSFYAFHLLYTFYKKRAILTEHLALIYGLALLLFLIPKVIPSAFLTGTMYGTPHIAIRFLSPDSDSYLTDIMSYLLLMNILPLVSLATLLFSKKRIDYTQVLLLTLLVIGVSFPLLFTFTNIIDWDQTYKFSLFNMFLSAILITVELEKTKEWKKYFIAAIATCVLISSQTTYDLFTKKLSLDFSSSNEPTSDMTDVVTFLSQNKTLLIPLKQHSTGSIPQAGQGVYCGGDETINEIAQYSGNFIRDSYKTNFLLSDSLENTYAKNASWANFEEKIRHTSKELDSGATLIVDKDNYDPSSRTIIEAIPGIHKREFAQYLLYRTKPW